MCQIRHLRADYDVEEGPPYAFSAILRLLDGDQAIETFEPPGTYGSKKAAKEKAADMAVTWLEQQPIPKKGPKDAGLLPLAAAKVDPSENWVGVLHGRSLLSHTFVVVMSGNTTSRVCLTLRMSSFPRWP